MADTIHLVYFAWVRERIGRDEETIGLPPSVRTVGTLLDYLVDQEQGYRTAFADREKLRFALDQDFVDTKAPLAAATELAIFPPVTGG